MTQPNLSVEETIYEAAMKLARRADVKLRSIEIDEESFTRLEKEFGCLLTKIDDDILFNGPRGPFKVKRCPVAQSVEQTPVKGEVPGSNPGGAANK